MQRDMHCRTTSPMLGAAIMRVTILKAGRREVSWVTWLYSEHFEVLLDYTMRPSTISRVAGLNRLSLRCNGVPRRHLTMLHPPKFVNEKPVKSSSSKFGLKDFG